MRTGYYRNKYFTVHNVLQLFIIPWSFYKYRDIFIRKDTIFLINILLNYEENNPNDKSIIFYYAKLYYMKIIFSTKYKSFKIPLTILKLTIFLFIANLCARVSIKHQNTS